MHFSRPPLLKPLVLVFLFGLALILTSPAHALIDNDGDGFYTDSGLLDCDDNDPATYPGAIKLCDGKDNNCDGKKDFSTDEDKDNDGVPWCAGDCDDNDPGRSPTNNEGPSGDPSCSDNIDNNCNQMTDSQDPGCTNLCQDNDGDGYGANGHPSCPNGTAVDCDDSKQTVNPGNLDNNCDNVDNDCSGTPDDGYVSGQTSCGTGACASTGQRICDNGVEINTCIEWAPETEGPMGDPSCSDSIDNDCNGFADMNDDSCMTACLDSDEDGYGANNDPDCPFEGFDCDDFDPDVNPGMLDDNCDEIDNNCSGTPDDEYAAVSTTCGTGACTGTGQIICQDGTEIDTCTTLSPAQNDSTCNGIDDDCDGIVDEDYAATVTNCGVSDCFSTGLLICQGGVEIDTCEPGALLNEGPPGDISCSDSLDNDCDGLTDSDDDGCISAGDNDGDGYTVDEGDCNDNDSTIYPSAPKLCDGKDNNCDGKKDFTTDEDKDNDGVPWCNNDCDDNNPARFPGNQEGPLGDPTCSDNIDNDCDNAVDLNDSLCNTSCLDEDNDGYGSNGDPACPGGTEVDCDDFNPGINPGASDSDCDNVDDNCSGTPDDAYVPVPTSCGVGGCAASGQIVCSNGITSDTCFPGEPQPEGPLGSPTCGDSVDNDCDGFTDDHDLSCLTPCFDNDGDGYGANGHADCPNGPAVDCEDNNLDVNPGASDSDCDNVDDNCSGTPDDAYVPVPSSCGVGACAGTGQVECQAGTEVDTCTVGVPGIEGPYLDATCLDSIDNDCDGLTDMNDILDCSSPDTDDDNDGFTETQGDCNDSDPSMYPGAPKICDGKDNNCDGRKDFTTDEDIDNDGVPRCANDCDDENPNESPNLKEGPFGDVTCNDNFDNDCSGHADLEDPACAPPSCVTKSNPKDGPHFDTLMERGADLIDPSDDTVHPDNSALLCGKCHGQSLSDEIRQKCERCHSEGGIFKQQYPLPWPYGFGSAQNVEMHSSTVVGTQYGNWDMMCVTCHNPHLQEQNRVNGTSYGKLIKEYICLDNPVTGLNIEEIIEFTSPSGPGSFADGPPHERNICEMCHTQTNHHRRNGSAPGDLDPAGNYTGHYDGTACTECHMHDEGFKPSCNACHQAPPPTGTHIKHYGGSGDDAVYGGTRITGDITAQSPVYVMDCGNCHPVDGDHHMNELPNSGGGDAEVELFSPSAPAGSLKAMNGPSAGYVPGPEVFTDDRGFTYTQGTCNNVYCHSSTNVTTSGDIPLPDVGYPLNYSPPWENFVVTTRNYQSPTWGVDTLGCNGCHGYPITTEFPFVSAGAGDSHAWIDDIGRLNLHVWNKGFGPLQCKTCHYNTVQENFLWIEDDFGNLLMDDTTIFNTAKHVNGTKDVAFSNDLILYPSSTQGDVFYDLTGAAFDQQQKTCSSVPCHKLQTEVKWGSPFRRENLEECNACHRY